MEIILVAAVAHGGVIGLGNHLPFRLASDLQFFKKTTLHQTLLLGRRTLESMGGPLPERRHLVLSAQSAYERGSGSRAGYATKELSRDTPPPVEWYSSFEGALERASELKLERLFVIGGERVFREALPLADELLLTHVHAALHGDTYFPEFPAQHFSRETLLQFSASAHDEYAGEVVRYRRILPG